MARVLICDDSMFMRMMIKKVLLDQGHTVVAEAENGVQAVRQYKMHKPDLTTMDITMPIMEGIQAVQKIREEDPNAKIIMVTAIGQKAIMTEAIDAGASGFLIKPFEPSQVRQTIMDVLGMNHQ